MAALDHEKCFCIIPWSALEQHGPQLPLETDDRILEAALDSIMYDPALEGDFLQLPAIHYGCSQEHMDFNGTVTLDNTTAARLLENIIASLCHHGFRKIIILNSHGGNTALSQAWAKEWEARYGAAIYHINFYISDFYTEAQPLMDTAVAADIHAGELETSILKYIAPELVRTKEISPDIDTDISLMEFYSGWKSAFYAPGNGVMGCPSRADAAKGELLFEYTCSRIRQYLREIAGFKNSSEQAY